MIHKSRTSALLAVTAIGISTAESALAMPADYCAAYANFRGAGVQPRDP